jgi:GH35 family endo-1,4-beta-xylanase
MPNTLEFDCADLRVGGVYVTDLRRRPAPGSRVTRQGAAIVIAASCESRLAVHAQVDVAGFGRTFCTADAGGEGYAEGGVLNLPRELAWSHLRRAERAAENLASAEPPSLAAAREAYARALWRWGDPKAMVECLAQALVAGEEAARVQALAALRQRDRSSPSSGPLVASTLFGERADAGWAIGVGPDWPPEGEPPDFMRPAAHNRLIADLCDGTTLPSFWRWIEPQRGQPRWEILDGTLEFCRAHGLAAKSFAILWGGIGGAPEWLRGLPYAQKLKAIERWTTDLVTRYRGQLAAWETVNEMHDWPFGAGLGFDRSQALEVTRLVNELVGALDSGTPRVINHCCIWGDYAQNRPATWTPLAYLDAVVAAGIPFEGIGLQYYNPGRDLLECRLHLDEFGRFGKDLWITEMGTPSAANAPGPVETAQLDPMAGWRGPWTPERQADWVELWYTLAAAHPAVRALNWWDFSDTQAFVAHAGLIDRDGQPKPAYHRLLSWGREHKLGKAPRQP